MKVLDIMTVDSLIHIDTYLMTLLFGTEFSEWYNQQYPHSFMTYIIDLYSLAPGRFQF